MAAKAAEGRTFKPDFEGYLRKQGHLVRSWRRRWFVIHGSTFAYFADEKDAATHSNFKGAHVVQSVKYVTSDEVVVMSTQNKDFHLRIDPDRPADIAAVFNAFDEAAQRSAVREARPSESFGSQVETAASAEQIQVGLEFSRNAHMPEAMSLFMQATKADPSNWTPYFYLGSAQYCLGDYAAAQRNMEAARSRNPANHDVAVNFAALLYLNGNGLAAKQILEDLSNDSRYAEHPDPDILNNLGLICTNLGLVDEACAHLRAAIRASAYKRPSETSTYYKAMMNLGDCLVLKRDFESALGCFEQCTRLDPGNVHAQLSVAKTFDERGDDASALESALAVLQLEPTNEAALTLKSKCERDPGGALRELRASGVDPEDMAELADLPVVDMSAPTPKVLTHQTSVPPPRLPRAKASFSM